MKSHYKFVALSALALTMACCQEDEVLNLEQFPDNEPQFSIDGLEGESVSTILATYQSDGTLVLNGEVSRNYTFEFAPSPEDANIHFDIIHTNVPKGKVSLSEEDVVLPAGFTTTGVTVTLQDEDFSFATENYDSLTYEVGVKASIKGYKVATESLESKIIIKKEAYVAGCCIVPEEGQADNFERHYFQNSIEEDEPIEFKFHVLLDKPARKDVKVKFATEGIKEQFGKDVVVTPAEVTIEAGQLTSEVVTWTIGKDFLLETDQPEVFDIQLKVVPESEDPVVAAHPELGVHSIIVDKKKIYINPNGSLDKYTMIPTDSYKAMTTAPQQNAKHLSDGDLGTFVFAKKKAEVVFDLQSQKNLVGASYCGPQGFAENKPQNVKIEISDDGKKYIEVGLFEIPKTPTAEDVTTMTPIELYEALPCRFVKMTFEKTAYTGIGGWMEKYYDSPAIAEVRFYTKD